MIKCSCGEDKCPICIRLDSYSGQLWFTDKDEKEATIYLDANTTVEFIKQLRRYLLDMTDSRDFI